MASVLIKKFISIRFVLTLLISYLVFSGIELLIDRAFHVDLHHILAMGGVGTVIILGFKLHLFCCVLPAAVSAAWCARRKHRHCSHRDHIDTTDKKFNREAQ